MALRTVEVFDHAGDQRSALGNLLKIGDYSNFVIICGETRHKVHKAIICLRSDFFKAACGSGFKVTLHCTYLGTLTYFVQEAQAGEIELREDDPFAGAYNCTAEGDCPLRDVVVRILKSKPAIFERKDVKEFLKEEGLAYDMVMSYGQDILRRRGEEWENCSEIM
ncbi:hypothetical protein J7337_013707 [Fusarium musae]|uniref:BTB domain-containing protein n=1 Tax=Fusarium musae TaxID=1042133 RepID=A0A9P8D540_9HYPO|nr:hypothetical protein J7337_013707 [Fusarium musae]KAG9495459.1 hypothetical protein J7337_013707 [Fusarium musae]